MPESFLGLKPASATPRLKFQHEGVDGSDTRTAVLLEALLHGAPTSGTVTAPPLAPSAFDSYLVPNEATGAWSGRAGFVAVASPRDHQPIGWEFIEPVVGMSLWIKSANATWTYNGPLKAILDAVVMHEPVRAASTVNATLASAFQAGATLDAVVVLAAGDRILIKAQTASEVNGIYVVQASGAPVRATDADAWTELKAAGVMVTEGTAAAGAMFRCTIDAGALGANAVTFERVAGVIPGTAWVQMVGTTVPATSTAPGVAGQIAYGVNSLYICTASNTWQKATTANF
jgi:hypothetical protein